MHLRLVAVSSRHHPGAGDQGASTEVVARVQRDLVGHRVLSALITSNNLGVLVDGGSVWERSVFLSDRWFLLNAARSFKQAVDGLILTRCCDQSQNNESLHGDASQ